jgi:hypothetical protein
LRVQVMSVTGYGDPQMGLVPDAMAQVRQTWVERWLAPAECDVQCPYPIQDPAPLKYSLRFQRRWLLGSVTEGTIEVALVGQGDAYGARPRAQLIT